MLQYARDIIAHIQPFFRFFEQLHVFFTGKYPLKVGGV
jgi:hypothetical protein